jgi:hypothetical protein
MYSLGDSGKIQFYQEEILMKSWSAINIVNEESKEKLGAE